MLALMDGLGEGLRLGLRLTDKDGLREAEGLTEALIEDE